MASGYSYGGGYSNGYNYATPKKSRKSSGPALKTEGSKAEAFFRAINKPGSAINQSFINAMKGENVFSGLKKGWQAEKQATGGDVIQQLRGGAAPTTRFGKVAQGVGGFALDVVNPLNPLNWLAIGAVSKAAKVAGKAVPFAKGLVSGERTLLSLQTPRIPGLIKSTKTFEPTRMLGLDKPAGLALQGAGQVARALPGAEKVMKGFSPTFKALRTSSNKMLGVAQRIVSREGTEGRKMPDLFKKAVKEIRDNGTSGLSPKLAKHYEKMGYTPEQIVGREVRRVLNAPIARGQRKNGFDVLIKRGFKKDEISDILKSVPTGGRTIGAISDLAGSMGSSLERLGVAKSERGLEGILPGYDPRPLSKETRELLGEQFKAGGERVFDKFTTEQIEYMARNPKLRDRFFGGVTGGQPIYKKPGVIDAIKEKSPKMASFYEDDIIKSWGKHVESSAKEIATADAVKGIAENPVSFRFSRKAWGKEAEGAARIEIPERYRANLKALKADGFNGKYLYAANDEVAKEAKTLMGVIGDPARMNEFMGIGESSYQQMLSMWKRWTLYGTPLIATPTIFRNFMGNVFLSWFRGATDAKSFGDSFKVAGALLKAGYLKGSRTDFNKLNAELSKLGALGDDVKYLLSNNAFDEGINSELMRRGVLGSGGKLASFEKAVGVDASAKANSLVEAISRTQHFLTRRKQGMSAEQALDDVRNTLYDYTGGGGSLDAKMRKLVPFWSWVRFNIPAMIEQTIKHPGRATVPLRVKQNWEGSVATDKHGNAPDERALSEYVKGDMSIRLWQDEKTGKWTYMRLKQFLPLADLEDVTSPKKLAEMMAGSITPAIKAPVEHMTNKSLFFKQAGGEYSDIENYPGETDKFLGMNIRKKNINLLRNVRLLNEVNKVSRVFGADKTKTSLSPGEYGVRLSGVSLVPTDTNKDLEQARYAYSKALSKLKTARKREDKRGGDTKRIDAMIERLKKESF